MSAKRLFVSLELPLEVTQLLAGLDPNIRGVRWLEPGQMHLTLSFLGNVSHETAETLKRNLRAVAWKAFFLPIIGLGKFPAKGPPNVLWVGVGTGHPHLFQLYKRVQEAALGAGLDPDLRSFHPHVTLARCRDVSEASVRPFLRSQASFDAGIIHVESFCLNSSELKPSGPVYTSELVCPCSGNLLPPGLLPRSNSGHKPTLQETTDRREDCASHAVEEFLVSRDDRRKPTS